MVGGGGTAESSPWESICILAGEAGSRCLLSSGNSPLGQKVGVFYSFSFHKWIIKTQKTCLTQLYLVIWQIILFPLTLKISQNSLSLKNNSYLILFPFSFHLQVGLYIQHQFLCANIRSDNMFDDFHTSEKHSSKHY